MDIQDEGILTEEQMQEKKVEALLSETLFGRPLSQIIGELEYSNQLNVLVLNTILKKNKVLTSESLEQLKIQSVDEINKKYGFELLHYVKGSETI